MKTKSVKRLLVPWIALFLLGSLPACSSTNPLGLSSEQRLTIDDQQPPPTQTSTATAIVAETETLAETVVSVTIVPSATPLALQEAPVAASPPPETAAATSPPTKPAVSVAVSNDLVSITNTPGSSGTLITPTVTPSGTVILPTVTPSGTVILPTNTPSGTVILPTNTPDGGTVILPTNTPDGGTVILPTATPVPACAVYPIALAQITLDGVAPGDVVADILNGGPPGNSGWLSWTGDSSAETLAGSLTPPGDGLVSVGDWVSGMPGVSNSKAVRDALDQLIGQVIVVPVWDQYAEQGANAVYHVVAFARVQISAYQLPKENLISAIYLGPETCAP